MLKIFLKHWFSCIFCIQYFPYTQTLVSEAQEKLDEIDGVTTVHSRFYDLSSNYYKLMGDHANYYRDALRYLGCLDVAEIPGMWWPLFGISVKLRVSMIYLVIITNCWEIMQGITEMYRDALRYIGCLDVAEIPGMWWPLFGISVKLRVSMIYLVIITNCWEIMQTMHLDILDVWM